MGAWNGIIFFLFIYHLGIYNEEITCFGTNRIKVFDNIIVYETICVYIPFKNLHTYVQLLYCE